LPAVKEIYKNQNFSYDLPELTSPLILISKVREVGGRVVGAMFLRLTAETFLVTEGSPVAKARAIEELQPEVLREAFEKGLDEVVCVVPPEIAESFSPALEKMGWSRDRDWPMWSRRTNEERDRAGGAGSNHGGEYGG
jgi:hypothetical protein